MLLSKKGLDAPFRIDCSLQYAGYWRELRFRLLRTFAIILIVFGFTSYAYKEIWNFFLGHLRQNCPALKIVSLSVLGPTTITVKLSSFASFFIGFLWFMNELWRFISPALNSYEKKFFIRCSIFFVSTTLYFQYVAFFNLLPYALAWFLSVNSQIVESSVDLGELIAFVFLIQKITFLITLWPFILFILMAQGWLSEDQVEHVRKYMYVLSFFVGMILTPPDIFSQCAVAVPLILCYELVLLSRKIWISLSIKKYSQK